MMTRNFGIRGMMAGSGAGGPATSIAAGATALGNLTFADGADLIMGTGGQILADPSAAANPGYAFRGQDTHGLTVISSVPRICASGSSMLNVSASGVIPQTVLTQQVTTGITASTTQSQGQGALQTTRNVFTIDTVANANDVVTMPTAVAGTVLFIANRGANTLQIFPASGDNFQGTAVNGSITLAAGAEAIYAAVDSTVWVRILN